MDNRELIPILKKIDRFLPGHGCNICGFVPHCPVNRCVMVSCAAERLEQLEEKLGQAVAHLRDCDIDCEYCIETLKPAPCQLDDTMDIDCEACTSDCECKECVDSNKWRWKGYADTEG